MGSHIIKTKTGYLMKDGLYFEIDRSFFMITGLNDIRNRKNKVKEELSKYGLREVEGKKFISLYSLRMFINDMWNTGECWMYPPEQIYWNLLDAIDSWIPDYMTVEIK